MNTTRYVLHMVLAVAVMNAASAQATVVRYEWDPVPGALYYRGAVVEGDAKSGVRTSGTRALLSDTAAVELRAYDAHGPLPGKVVLRVVAPSSLAEPSLSPPAVAESPQPPPPQLPSQAPATKTAPPAKTRVALLVGIGRDAVAASFGVSEFSGEAEAAGGRLEAQRRTDLSPVTFGGFVDAHPFTTEMVASTGATDEGTRTVTIWRWTAQAQAAYDLLGDSRPQRLDIGLGATYRRIPALGFEDDDKKTARLVGVSTVGPHVSLGYEYDAEAWRLGATALHVPRYFTGGTSGRAVAAELALGYRLAAAWAFETRFASRIEALTIAGADCGDVTACRATNESEVRETTLLIGTSYQL